MYSKEVCICPHLLIISGPGKPLLTSQLQRAKREGTSLSAVRPLLTVYGVEVAACKGTSKGQKHPKTPAVSLHRREGGDATPPRCTVKQLDQEGSIAGS